MSSEHFAERWTLLRVDDDGPSHVTVNGPWLYEPGERVEVMPVAEHLDYIRRAGEIHDREVDDLLAQIEKLRGGAVVSAEQTREHWMVVRRSRKIPGGYRVVKHGLRSEEEAVALAAAYKRPHEAMTWTRLLAIRTVALEEARS